MKKALLTLPFLLLPWLCPTSTMAQQQAESVAFSIDVNEMIPLRYQSRMLSYGYSIEVRNDSLSCYLPYMGQVQQPELDNSGLDFKSPLLALKSAKGKKGQTNIVLICKKNFITYQFNITVLPTGKCYIRLTPSNADGISYEGELR